MGEKIGKKDALSFCSLRCSSDWKKNQMTSPSLGVWEDPKVRCNSLTPVSVRFEP